MFRWLFGFITAMVLTWIISLFLSSSLCPLSVEPEIGMAVPSEGVVVRQRKEGWAETRFGKYGIPGIPDLKAVSCPKVFIWGDSYVEAQNVPDHQKIAQQVTRLSAARIGYPLVGVGIGESGAVISDYFYRIPRYETVAKPAAHFIVIAGVDDVLPDEQYFRTAPEYRLVEKKTHSNRTTGLRRLVIRYDLQFLYVPAQRLFYGDDQTSFRKLRFLPGPVSRPSPIDGPSVRSATLAEAWSFLLAALRGQTDKPIAFVYSPSTDPKQKISLQDPDAELKERFRAACRAGGVGFVDLSERFRRYYVTTGKFASGFHNGVPSEGHWNEAGHRLAAEAICDYLSNTHHVVHSN